MRRRVSVEARRLSSRGESPSSPRAQRGRGGMVAHDFFGGVFEDLTFYICGGIEESYRGGKEKYIRASDVEYKAASVSLYGLKEPSSKRRDPLPSIQNCA